MSLGGFDTHADENGTQQAQLGVLDSALTGFLQDVAGDPVATASPRSSTPNSAAESRQMPRRAPTTAQPARYSSPGAQSKAASTVLGHRCPTWTTGTLKVSTDFRDVYAELLHKLLGTDPARVVGNSRSELGFLA